MPRFRSSVLPARPIVQRQAVAAVAVQSASDAATVADTVVAVAIDPGSGLGTELAAMRSRITDLEQALEN